MAKSNERISFEKIENGFLVEHSYEEGEGMKMKWTKKRYYTKSANDTRDKMIELQKTIKIN